MTKKRKKKKPRELYRPRVRDDKPTRQAAWAKVKIKEGKCSICAKPLNLYLWRCDYHAKLHKQYVRKKRGNRAWQPGRPGRPPKTAQKKGK